MDVYGDNASLAGSGRAGTGLDLCNSVAVGDTKVGSNEGERDDLKDDTQHERSAPANEVDDEDGEQEDGDEFDDGIQSGSQEARLLTLDAKVAEN